jgi:hypothetical protein
MKNYYDKVLFLLGFIVLGIGAGIFFEKGGSPKPAHIPPLHLSGNHYTAVDAPTIDEPNPLWEGPPDQGEDRNDPGWTYSIFTPPKIWWETGTGWIIQSPNPPGPKPPFGLHLVKADEERYRVQVQGVSGAGDKDDIINFSDEDDGNDFRLKVGEESTEHQIKVLDMTIPDQGPGDHGLWNKSAIVTILDERTNETVTLTQGVLYSPTGNRYFILQFEAPFPEQEWRVTKVGDTQEFPGSTTGFNLPDPITFVVDALDFDTPSVTVERQTKNKHHIAVTPETQILKLPDTSIPSPDVTPGSATKTPTRSTTYRLPAPTGAKPASTGPANPVTGLANKPAAAPPKATTLPVGSKLAPSSANGTSK